MCFTTNIAAFYDVFAFIHNQKEDDIARKSTHKRAFVKRVEEKGEEKKEVQCRICDKKHVRRHCLYTCTHCKKKVINQTNVGQSLPS